MKFTLSWLRDHLDTTAGAAEIAEALTDMGLEVEAVSDPAETLGAFTIVRVIEAMPHPDADRLRVCRVETWPQGPDAAPAEVQVVCGAPNARTGMIGVFAPPGTHIPGTGLDLKPGVIRGVESNGMLCSERELMLSDDHEGIIELPADAPLGSRYIDYAGLNDPVIEIAVTPNRPDALGVAGIARDLAARGLGRLITPAVTPVPGGFPCPVTVRIDEDVLPRGCPIFAGRLIRGVRNGPSPDWLRRRLRAIGLRPISALVDITNFVTFDRARPLHVFDADRLQGGLRVHFAKGGERITGLDDKEYTLEAGMIAISDESGPESIAGVMGGAATGCTEETVNVFLESAYWDPVMIAQTGRKLKLHTDARYRFERGVDPAFTPAGLELGTRMILDLCGGEASEPEIAGAVPDTARSYRLDLDRTRRLVGLDVPPPEQRRILQALGFGVKDADGAMQVSVPSWRPDVQGEADLVEEIARITSLSGLKGQPLARPVPGVTPVVLTPAQRRAALVRRGMAARGLVECVTYSFISERAAELFGGGGDAVRLDNPISSEMTHMRPDLLPGLLAAAARNQARGANRLALFEVGPVFHGGQPGEQSTQAAALRVGDNLPRNAFSPSRPADAFDAKGDAEALLAALGVPVERLMVLRDDLPGWMHPGRAAWLSLGPKNRLALIGELHPKVLEEMDVKGPAVAATLYLDRVPQPRSRATGRPALRASDYQAVERDFAFVLDAGVPAGEVLRAARGADKTLIADVELFDIFEGAAAEAQLGPGRKSLAVGVRLQPMDRTLTDAEIEAVGARIVAAVKKATGGVLRG
ncbi:MAG: phenylalanine--tRNA ligase subunit beta [Alphaproteobacteria bacterium]|nr:MAG: phenylalanine--tRNA ligase subunit beta [Alphaproteobacteria bacterium]